MYIKVKSLVNVKGKKIYIGDIGEMSDAWQNVNVKTEVVPVYFKNHAREFYWKPIFMKRTDIEVNNH
jgi:hypothetical protein